MKVTEVIVRKDKVSGEVLVVLLDTTANRGYLPYVQLDGVFDEMRMDYYTFYTKRASEEEVKKAIDYIKEKYDVDEVIVRYKLPVGFRNRIWPNLNKKHA